MKNKTAIHYFFVKAIGRTIDELGMLEKKDCILAGVSGGPDSVALLMALLDLKKEYDLKIGIAHLNHMLRGDESLTDEQFVKELADQLALPFHGAQEDIAAYAVNHRLSVEEAGRKARYSFFDHIADTRGYGKIATGHTKDDNAELVLMNLLRGAGPKGLSGIPAIRDGKYIRPLIRVSKQEILDFLADRQQGYRIDSSNKNMAYLRNQIRSHLIPHLESTYNPEITDALNRLSRVLKQEDEFLDTEARNAFHTCLIQSDIFSVTFSKPELSLLHPALLSRVMRMAIKRVKKNLNRISFIHIENMIKFCFRTVSGRSLDLPGQIRIYKTENTICVKKERKPLREIGGKEKKLRQIPGIKQDKES